eukprot:scaffold73953_cov32-Tisochrysis_lutea.AAC.2
MTRTAFHIARCCGLPKPWTFCSPYPNAATYSLGPLPAACSLIRWIFRHFTARKVSIDPAELSIQCPASHRQCGRSAANRATARAPSDARSAGGSGMGMLHEA